MPVLSLIWPEKSYWPLAKTIWSPALAELIAFCIPVRSSLPSLGSAPKLAGLTALNRVLFSNTSRPPTCFLRGRIIIFSIVVVRVARNEYRSETCPVLPSPARPQTALARGAAGQLSPKTANLKAGGRRECARSLLPPGRGCRAGTCQQLV